MTPWYADVIGKNAKSFVYFIPKIDDSQSANAPLGGRQPGTCSMLLQTNIEEQPKQRTARHPEAQGMPSHRVGDVWVYVQRPEDQPVQVHWNPLEGDYASESANRMSPWRVCG
jgi:hypothetical protein